ncbi:hypothetical protein QH494_22465 [Sphingomonas sp. AR_OL41]|uniref:hypothetical protein n=1 Tax=Sphingomonas sp. AR_OL41 TaxID=3042729 RepID=UPI00247FDD15|nr:hypothetical protein [Sphingomonas sp. AR_OL41]MDH7974960.1 hypothetical protein [Sphingomonas sp. AR_OL41]
MARYSLHVLALALLFVVANCAVLLTVSAPIAAEYWVRETLIVKRAAAARIAKPKLLLAGGSSTLFSIDTAAVEQATGRPAYNYAIHASMRLEWLLAEWRRAARSGDVVVMILEPPFYDCGSQDWGSWQLRNALAWDRDYLNALPWPRRVNALLTGGNITLPFEILRARAGAPAALLPRRRAAMVAPAQVLQRYAHAAPSTQFEYSPGNLNAHGDMQHTIGLHYKGPPADVTLPGKLCAAVGAELGDFVGDMRRRDVRVFFDYAPYLVDGKPKQWRSADAAFINGMRGYGLTMLSHRDEQFFPRNQFFDTDLHLNATGRKIRTAHLIAHLAAAGL